MAGPLSGVKVVELAGIGPGPFAAMMLADQGADVVRVDRPRRGTRPDRPAAPVGPSGGGDPPAEPLTGRRNTQPYDTMGRGRRSVAIDLKHPGGVEAVLRLVTGADVLIEGFRPGVAERLGVGPADCHGRNPRLVYGRMTGWGQEGPYAAAAGHDINYSALSGSLSLIGRRGQPPLPPVNFLADFGGGGMLLAFGIAAALWEAARSGRGQVVDAAMVDGAALLSTMVWGFAAAGGWGERGTNLLDTGAWFYEVYECADGGYVSLGSLEPQFYAEMVRRTGLADNVDGRGPLPGQGDRDSWSDMKQRMAALIRTRTRAEWCSLLEGSDACFAPVLTTEEAPEHPHNRERGTFIDVGGVVQPAPAPRFDRTPWVTPEPAPAAGADTDEVLAEAGFDEEEVAALRHHGAVW
jgi:alpha-methylacyl-CoA racemase